MHTYPLNPRLNLRRLDSARRVIEPYAAANRAQRELKAFLMVAMDHMEWLCRKPGEELEFERWWDILRGYWRALKSPEMTGRRAKTALADLFEPH